MNVLDRINLKAFQERVPFNIHFDLTYRCPQRCIHCYLPEASRRGEGPGAELNTAQVKEILGQLATSGALFLNLSGGEIFLRDDLFTILEYAHSLNLFITMFTSGTKGPDRDGIRRLKDLRVQGLYFSFYGLEPQLHDQVTGVTGSWERAWRTMQECRELGLRVVFNSSAFASNYSGLAALHQYAVANGIPIRLGPLLLPRWDGLTHPPGLALKQEMCPELYHELGWLDEEIAADQPEPGSLVGRCGAGDNFCYLTPWGEVRPCPDVAWDCGRLPDRGDFHTIWKDSPPLNRFREIKAAGGFSGPICNHIRHNNLSSKLTEEKEEK